MLTGRNASFSSAPGTRSFETSTALTILIPFGMKRALAQAQHLTADAKIERHVAADGELRARIKIEQLRAAARRDPSPVRRAACGASRPP